MLKKIWNLGKLFFLLILILTNSCKKDDDVQILSANNFITSFKLTSGGFTKNFEIKENKIEGSLPYTVDEMDISLEIVISDQATISPDPRTITTIKDPIDFVVTAEDGTKKSYTVEIKRELNSENSITLFEIKTAFFETEADINESNNTIQKRLLPNTDLQSLNPKIIISDRATISPDPKTISDYTNPVTYKVTAENGESKEYTIDLQLMNEEYVAQCDISNASKWFGGDDRVVPDYPEIGPRNVGTGQVIRLAKDTYPTKFGFLLREPFRSDQTNTQYMGDLELKLNIRDVNGVIVASKNVMINGPFAGGWIDFDLASLNLLLKKNTQYNFTYYLIDGEVLGVSSGSDANLNADSGICGSTGWSGESKKKNNTSLEDWEVWWSHEWHFNFRLEAKQ
ncbi:DUF5018 domain-containing protein [Aquimarina muelleri]|uniref:DUF5018 domain-containing protein n=1 Tax=Aquimarina muelleri TaxID=279356 RepID=A0A918JUU0_9FLAO|nr:DUF5018 domain-containing protein [Aquimarina muelleri]MCX2762794.1 DUF5018 domain-containing protein [Aquimarina muelleri]GGX11911.1 hypothetical protein GCM10007384_12030 [Aquimarina muelleri]